MPDDGQRRIRTFVERRHPSGRVSLHSAKLEALGVDHGFTTRAGGLDVRSAADLTGPLEDAGLEEVRVRFGRQVHGTRINFDPASELPADGQGSPRGERNAIVGVRTADCLPVLMVGDTAAIAVHVGWRGLVDEIVPAAVSLLGGPSRLVAVALGPCIGPHAFEIGPDVADRFAAAGLESCLRSSSGDRSFANLQEAALLQLSRCGVPAEQVEACRLCTHHRDDLFYSYRRDGPGGGHQAAWIRPGNPSETRTDAS